jgi:poly(A) polymerase Pap1
LFRSGEKEVAGDLAVFGSYRLGANGKDSDIDLILLAPGYIDRELHFFS